MTRRVISGLVVIVVAVFSAIAGTSSAEDVSTCLSKKPGGPHGIIRFYRPAVTRNVVCTMTASHFVTHKDFSSVVDVRQLIFWLGNSEPLSCPAYVTFADGTKLTLGYVSDFRTAVADDTNQSSIYEGATFLNNALSNDVAHLPRGRMESKVFISDPQLPFTLTTRLGCTVRLHYEARTQMKALVVLWIWPIPWFLLALPALARTLMGQTDMYMRAMIFMLVGHFLLCALQGLSLALWQGESIVPTPGMTTLYVVVSLLVAVLFVPLVWRAPHRRLFASLTLKLLEQSTALAFVVTLWFAAHYVTAIIATVILAVGNAVVFANYVRLERTIPTGQQGKNTSLIGILYFPLTYPFAGIMHYYALLFKGYNGDHFELTVLKVYDVVIGLHSIIFTTVPTVTLFIIASVQQSSFYVLFLQYLLYAAWSVTTSVRQYAVERRRWGQELQSTGKGLWGAIEAIQANRSRSKQEGNTGKGMQVALGSNTVANPVQYYSDTAAIDPDGRAAIDPFDGICTTTGKPVVSLYEMAYVPTTTRQRSSVNRSQSPARRQQQQQQQQQSRYAAPHSRDVSPHYGTGVARFDPYTGRELGPESPRAVSVPQYDYDEAAQGQHKPRKIPIFLPKTYVKP